MSNLFPLAEYWWFYLGFIGFVAIMLALDLGVFHRKAHAVSFKEAAGWSFFWVSLALLFNFGFYQYALYRFQSDHSLMAIPGFNPDAEAARVGMEFLTGYVVEKALAVDNIFVFVLVFSAFRIPAVYQHRVLFLGILGALFFRAIFIALGAQLMAYHWVVILFGVFLIGTGVKMLLIKQDEEPDPSKSKLLIVIRKFIPVTPEFHGQKFMVRKNGKLFATPLLLALVFLEMSDIVFAVDSVPAIFALTKEPLIVFTSNILAILGLRSMYFMLAGVIDRFIYLKHGLALVLIFVGLKMTWLNGVSGPKIPIALSLGVIAGLIFGSMFISLLVTKRKSRRVEQVSVE